MLEFIGITVWEIFSFGEKPYYREFNLKKPGDVKEHLKKKKTMKAPQNYLGIDKDMRKLLNLYDEVMRFAQFFFIHREIN